jgi:hypothetical protein
VVATRGISEILRPGEQQIGYNGHFDNVLQSHVLTVGQSSDSVLTSAGNRCRLSQDGAHRPPPARCALSYPVGLRPVCEAPSDPLPKGLLHSPTAVTAAARVPGRHSAPSARRTSVTCMPDTPGSSEHPACRAAWRPALADASRLACWCERCTPPDRSRLRDLGRSVRGTLGRADGRDNGPGHRAGCVGGPGVHAGRCPGPYGRVGRALARRACPARRGILPGRRRAAGRGGHRPVDRPSVGCRPALRGPAHPPVQPGAGVRLAAGGPPSGTSGGRTVRRARAALRGVAHLPGDRRGHMDRAAHDRRRPERHGGHHPGARPGEHGVRP